jgi:hypothetical protein
MQQPLVNKTCLLQKFQENGGWTYTLIPEIAPDPKARFGWVKVRGSIDGYEIEKHHLMPSGTGQLMLFVKAEIRKKIKKQAGDTVHIILYPDNEPLEISEELLLCLQDEPKALIFFNSLNDSEKYQYIKWIYSAKTDETKVDRIAKTIDRLLKGQKIGDSKG